MKYLILKPENHKIIKPEKDIKIAVPRSGWVITKMEGIIIIVKETNIDVKELVLVVRILWKNLARQSMTAIFISSEGCKFKKYRFIHLLDPEAVTPYKATQTNKPKIST